MDGDVDGVIDIGLLIWTLQWLTTMLGGLLVFTLLATLLLVFVSKFIFLCACINFTLGSIEKGEWSNSNGPTFSKSREHIREGILLWCYQYYLY